MFALQLHKELEGIFISFSKISLSGSQLLVYHHVSKRNVLGWQSCVQAADRVQLSNEASPGAWRMMG